MEIGRISDIRKTFYSLRSERGFLEKHRELMPKLPKICLLLGMECEGYKEVYDNREILIEEGKIFLGTVIIANNTLFEPTGHDYPAFIAYSEDEFFEENPVEMKRLASEVFAKSSEKDKSMYSQKIRELLNMLGDESKPIYNIMLPRELTEGKVIYLTTMLIEREALPNKFLDIDTFPIIVHEDLKGGAILHHKFWLIGQKIKKEKEKIKSTKRQQKKAKKGKGKWIILILILLGAITFGVLKFVLKII